MLRPGENVPQCPSKLVTTHRWKVQSASASISSRTRAPAARRTRRMFLRYFPKPGDVTAGPGWIPSHGQHSATVVPPETSHALNTNTVLFSGSWTQQSIEVIGTTPKFPSSQSPAPRPVYHRHQHHQAHSLGDPEQAGIWHQSTDRSVSVKVRSADVVRSTIDDDYMRITTASLEDVTP